METLLDRLQCEFKMLEGLHGNALNWSSGEVNVDHRSPNDEEDVDDTDDADEAAVYKHQTTHLGLPLWRQVAKPKTCRGVSALFGQQPHVDWLHQGTEMHWISHILFKRTCRTE